MLACGPCCPPLLNPLDPFKRPNLTRWCLLLVVQVTEWIAPDRGLNKAAAAGKAVGKKKKEEAKKKTRRARRDEDDGEKEEDEEGEEYCDEGQWQPQEEDNEGDVEAGAGEGDGGAAAAGQPSDGSGGGDSPPSFVWHMVAALRRMNYQVRAFILNSEHYQVRVHTCGSKYVARMHTRHAMHARALNH